MYKKITDSNLKGSVILVSKEIKYAFPFSYMTIEFAAQ